MEFQYFWADFKYRSLEKQEKNTLACKSNVNEFQNEFCWYQTFDKTKNKAHKLIHSQNFYLSSINRKIHQI